MLHVPCPHCHQVLSIPEQYAGKSGTCQKCGAPVTVPALQAQQRGRSAAGAVTVGQTPDLLRELDLEFEHRAASPVVINPSFLERVRPMLLPVGLTLGAVVVICVAFTGVSMLAGSLRAGAGGPEKAARKFAAAMSSGDAATLRSLFTAKIQTYIQDDVIENGGLIPVDTAGAVFSVGKGAITNDTASVPLTATEDDESETISLLMRRESGEWRVFGMEAPGPFGSPVTMNFEDLFGIFGAFEQGFEEFGKQMEQGFEEMFQEGFGPEGSITWDE